MIRARLRAHGLLEEAQRVAAHHGCPVDELTDDARVEFTSILKQNGWSEANAFSLLGIPPPKSGTRLAVPRDRSALEPVKIGERDSRERSRDPHRSRRQRDVRSRTESVRQLPKRELQRDGALYPERPGVDYQRPKTRAECVDGPRPCPFVSCQHNLFLDVSAKTGAIKLNFPDLEPDQLEHSCALDEADAGGLTLYQIARRTNLTRERVRQIQGKATSRMKALPGFKKLIELLDGAEVAEPDARATQPG